MVSIIVVDRFYFGYSNILSGAFTVGSGLRTVDRP